MKKRYWWLIGLLVIIVGGATWGALWLKERRDNAPDEIEDPGIEVPEGLVIPEPEDLEIEDTEPEGSNPE